MMRLLVYICHMTCGITKYVCGLALRRLSDRIRGLNTSAQQEETVYYSPDPFPSQRGGVWGRD